MKNTGATFVGRKRSPKIVLTVDETMMSKYRWGIFIGFSTCMPQGIFPEWFYFSVFSPPVPRKNGRAVYADFGLRIVESCLADVFGENEVTDAIQTNFKSKFKTKNFYTLVKSRNR